MHWISNWPQYLKFKRSTIVVSFGIMSCYLILSMIKNFKPVQRMVVQHLELNQIKVELLESPHNSIRSNPNHMKSSHDGRSKLNLGPETLVHNALGLGSSLENLDEYNSSDLSTKKYVINIWKHGDRMVRRFLRSYGENIRDPFEFCTVSNCEVSIDDSKVAEADAVMFHLHQTRSPSELPNYHPPNQMWIFFTDESPHNSFYANRKQQMKDYNNIFNWSMTYRHDSDIPVPYGRTIPLDSPLTKQPNFAEKKKSLVTILGSNCGGLNHRWNYVRELEKHIKVDIFGKCGKRACPGAFMKNCPLLKQYKFYLAFENTNCKEYMTEKLWWNAYHMDAVPVVMGSPKEDYVKLCPPQSFIHVDDFKNPAELGQYLTELDSNDEAYNQYFQWKMHYKVLNEHGYFGSPSQHICHMCEKLNSKYKKPKVYTDLDAFWNKKRDCN